MENLNCIRCGVELDNNIHLSDLKKRWYICKSCSNLRKRLYKQTKSYKQKSLDYRQSEHGREIRRLENKKLRHTPKGRIKKKRDAAKRRGLGWTPLFENPFNEPVEWHHVSNEFVVAIPTDIHQIYCGYKNHKELCMNIINQIYF